MPKVNDTQLPDRLRKRIEELEAGAEVDAKDIRAVLTDEQMADLGAARAAQKLLRKGKRATTVKQQQALGWKTIREVRLEILRQALVDARANLPDAFQSELEKQKVRQGRIYFDTYGAAIDAGYDNEQARNMANNELTRAGLNRIDGQRVELKNVRDRKMWDIEEQLMQRINSEMTAEELEQHQILADARIVNTFIP